MTDEQHPPLPASASVAPVPDQPETAVGPAATDTDAEADTPHEAGLGRSAARGAVEPRSIGSPAEAPSPSGERDATAGPATPSQAASPSLEASEGATLMSAPPAADGPPAVETPQARSASVVAPEDQPFTGEPTKGLPGEPAPTSGASAGNVPPAGGDEGFLEELTLPSLIAAPNALSSDATLGPEGRLRVGEHLGTRGRVNRYAATWRDDAEVEVPVELREAPADHAGLRREAEILADVRYAMLPALRAAFEDAGQFYLAVDRLDGETLDRELRTGMPPERALSIVLQLTQAVRRLHRAGWAVTGLSPADVVLGGQGASDGGPVRLTQLGDAAKIGETPARALHVAGYSAPELAYQEPVTGKEDVYTLGAILYHALAGHPLPETGAEHAALSTTLRTPGAPQLLSGALETADERSDLEIFYRGLLALRQRLDKVTVTLEVASATTVGLNPTRPVNEDSCGYATWSVGVAEGVSYRALLCVADGMGGMDAGEVASRAALTAVMRGAASLPSYPEVATEADAETAATTSPEPPARSGVPGTSDAPSPGVADGEPPPLDPVALVRAAAPVVHAAAQGRQMGTTATLVAVQDGELTLGHIGDTRAYLLRDGTLTQLTADHSLVAAMVASGVITPEEAEGHPDSNKVLRSLGSQRELPDKYVDSLEARYGQPSLQLRPGDWLILCTDGVWGSVPDATIRTVASEALDPPTAARRLIELALEAGAPDNAATVVARCVRMPVA